MTPDRMLAELHEAGEDADSDFHDGLHGWFGWELGNNGTRLTVRFETEDGTKYTESWTLVKEAK